MAWCANGLALLVLAAGLLAGKKAGYEISSWKGILQEQTYVETSEFQEEAASAVYGALEAAARDTRMEAEGVYEPNRIIRIREYLDSGVIYDDMPESEKLKGISYRLGDLYQWSLKGASYTGDILREAYRPLFYGSIQEYCNECDEEYRVVVNQILEAMKEVQREVALYQEQQKTWAEQATNVRYLLWDLGNQNVFTNVTEFEENITQESCEAYFKNLGSYYIYDSRTVSVAQENVGDYYSYNTHELLADWNAHLSGEYLVCAGVDMAFPVQDPLAAAAAKYESAAQELRPYLFPMTCAAAVLAVTGIWLLIQIGKVLWALSLLLMQNADTVFRVIICFLLYLLLEMVLWVVFGGGALSVVLLAAANLVTAGFLAVEAVQRQKILETVQNMNGEEEAMRVSEKGLFSYNRQMARAINDLGDGLRHALQEQMKSERMKADLITNVSHDLKTPLTSIINYVDLLKKEKLDNPRAEGYLQVLDQKSQRLKQLTEDLVEASRASSGNVVLNMEQIDLLELLLQTGGEFEERLKARGLMVVEQYPKNPQYVEADGRRLWRILENLYRNVEKYAMPHTRVYLQLDQDEDWISFSMKNISERPLNISAEELTERFTRGDESRSTEGSGLGLSIAKDLTEIQNGKFEIYLDGDLFKVTVSFPRVNENR